jgi:XTP/dITP diphosphohydrolase
VTPRRLVLATANPGKVSELRNLLATWGPVEVLSLGQVALPEERYTSYEDNAIAKARAAAAATGLPALGDDSGLEVDFLAGGPGVRSARWAPSDVERIGKLLDALVDVPPSGRGARFRCVVALAWPDGQTVTAEGTCAGRIATAPRGTAGFGYDPVFVSDDLGCTFAEASAEAKERVGHRGRAVRALGALLAHDRGK